MIRTSPAGTSPADRRPADRRRWWWVAAAVPLVYWAHLGRLLPGDRSLLQLAGRLPKPPLDALTFLGSAIGIALLTLVLAWLLQRHLRPIVFIVAVAAVQLPDEILKRLVHRSRPPGAAGLGPGFPSGHAMASLVLALLVCGTLWPTLSPTRKVQVGAVAGAFAVAIGISRIGLGVHWPSDVLGGWLIGAAYALWTLPLIQLHGPHGLTL